MTLSEQQIESLSPNPAAFLAGKKLSAKEQWVSFARSGRSIWGAIKGSGKSPYLTQIDTAAVAYKCTCPSRQFPCKHSIALMLLYQQHGRSFESKGEPDWVKEWMDRRVAKEHHKKEEPEESTTEEQEQREKNKEKTQVNRLASVMTGVTELELWLKDLVRMGFIELPNKTTAEYNKVVARMVDAKAPGLAALVKAYSRLDFQNAEEWQREAMAITARLFLLLRTLKNYEQLTPLWQQTIRTLSGWSQSTKELLADSGAETVSDTWLVAGQQTEETDDDITVQRNWLIGITTNRAALVLNFGTRFSALESTLTPGVFMEAELSFFASVLPQRAAVKRQKNIVTAGNIPAMMNTWEAVLTHRNENMKINPWANDFVIVLADVRLVNSGQHWVVCDREKYFMPLAADVDIQTVMRWVALSGNRALPMALVLRGRNVLPLGIFHEQTYQLL